MPSTLDLAARLSAIVAAQQDILSRFKTPLEVMKLCVRHTQQITDGDGAAIEEIEGDELVYRAVSGRAIAAPGLRLPIKDSLSGASLTSLEPLRCDDTETDKRVNREACRKIGIRSMIVVPLLRDGKPSGVLKSFSERPNFFDDLDTYSVELLAGTTAVVLALAAELEARHVSEERYRMLFEKNVAGVFRTTRDGKFLDCNSAFAGCLGYASRDELLSRESWDIYPSRADRETFLATLDRDRVLTNVRLQLKKKDGSHFAGIVNVSLIPGEHGEQQLLGTLVCV